MSPRLRALARMLARLLLPLAIALAAVSAGWSHENPRRQCKCPQMSEGWVLFPDPSPRTPDFWWQEEVVVQEITLCPHGIQFRFMAEEEGNPHLVSLVFTMPHALSRPYRDPERSRQAVVALEAKMRQLFAETLGTGNRLDFQRLPASECPRILQPSRRLVLEWQGQEVELRGYLDVYMTQLI